MEGTTLSHYKVKERLGAGGMGVVYHAEDTRLDRSVAIKVLSTELGADERARARFIQEAKAASALDHPNICSIYDIGTAPDGRLYMVMAHYDGSTLDALIEHDPLPSAEALGIVVQVVDGLAKAHARGITHRDIKPSNLMLTGDGVVKILDFGLAKIAGAEGITRTGTSVGTPRYMSPEQIRGDAADHRSDIWSVGVVLYTLLAGTPPFRGEHPQAIMYSVVNEDPRPLSSLVPDIPEGVQPIVDRCLAKNPADRYQDTSDLLRDLRTLLHITASHTSPALGAGTRSSIQAALRLEKRSGRKVGMRKFGWAALAAIAVSVVVLIGQQLTPPRRHNSIRVLVAPPTVVATQHEDDGQTFASSARIASLRTLSAMEGIVPLESSTRSTDIDPLELARIQDAEEVVTTSITDTGREWLVSVRRVRAGDGGVVWAQEFHAPYQHPLLFSDALTGALSRAYPDRHLDESAARINMDTSTYGAYVRAFQEYSLATVSGETGQRLVDSLEVIRQKAPNFVDAYVLEATICRSLYESSRDNRFLERALGIIADAHERAPGDARTSTLLFDIALRSDQEDKANMALASLKRIDPSSDDVSVCEAMLAEHQGRSEKAIDLMRTAVERSPSRSNVFRLADMEYRHGNYDEARDRLESLLKRFPDFDAARIKLAELELLYGEPERAESLYSEVVARRPTVGWVTNLGLARELLGQYGAAASDFERALRLAPGNPYVMLNLADCRVLLGNSTSADSLYEKVLDSYGDLQNLAWDDRMVVAQCLAHLGRQREAVRTAQDALRDSQEHSEALYLASIVYAVVGDRLNALVTAQKAIDQGVEPRWFRLPWFDDLRNEPEFAKVPRD